MNKSAIACDPSLNVVVEACAGSGKTWLLTSRLFRILLEGARPDEVLAITFTRKAALEMRHRLADLLCQCALASDSELDRELSVRGLNPTPELRDKARSLAGLVLTHPRGVTIDTFHGWFASLCQMAPLGSGFSRQAEPTDQIRFWVRLAVENFLAESSQKENAAEPWSVAMVSLASGLDTPDLVHLLTESLFGRIAGQLWLLNRSAPCLEDQFEYEADKQWPEEVLRNGQLLDLCTTFARWLGHGTPTQQKKATELETLCTAIAQAAQPEVGLYNAIVDQFFTQNGDPRSIKHTKDQLPALGLTESDYRQHVEAIQRELQIAQSKAVDQRDYRRTADLRQILPRLYDGYQNLKTEASVIDFDDLESVALMLLMDEQQRAYMQQKLDVRVRHLLIDEFQDTNPVQWSILRLWLGDYGADSRPSVFLVGDPKQSIYRFRRAEARLFDHARKWLQTHFDAKLLESDDTRRCSTSVIGLVNRVLVNGPRSGSTPIREHGCADPATQQSDWPGLVAYPLIDRKDQALSSPDEATCVANSLLAMKASGQLESYSQVLVLVKSHKSAHKLAPALRLAGIPHQLRDIGERYKSIIWSDTLALFAWLDCPDDNFSLLQLLRSPLIGISAQQFGQLVSYSSQGGIRDVWIALQALSSKEAWAMPLVRMLADWLNRARALPLFEVVSEVARSSNAAENYLNWSNPTHRLMFAEHWDWLKGWALQVNGGRFPSLAAAVEQARVLQETGGSDGESENPDAVRIMTVHSAKGLEADYVWLFDAASEVAPRGSSLEILLDWPLGQLYPDGLFVGDKSSQASIPRKAVYEVEQKALDDEEDHLLYVALTRARKQVHMSGTTDRHGKIKGWFMRLEPFIDQRMDWVNPQVENTADSHFMWVRPACPAVQPLGIEVGQVTVEPSSSALLKGTALHGLLEWVNSYDGNFDSFWALRQVDCEAVLSALDQTELDEVKDCLRGLLVNSSLATWLRGAEIALNEYEWIDENGKLLRADRLVCNAGVWTVLDYKWTVDSSNYDKYCEQVRGYMRLVNATLNSLGDPASTNGALIDRLGQIHKVSWV